VRPSPRSAPCVGLSGAALRSGRDGGAGAAEIEEEERGREEGALQRRRPRRRGRTRVRQSPQLGRAGSKASSCSCFARAQSPSLALLTGGRMGAGRKKWGGVRVESGRQMGGSLALVPGPGRDDGAWALFEEQAQANALQHDARSNGRMWRTLSSPGLLHSTAKL